MKKNYQKQLTDNVNLVKWQEKMATQKFNLLTVHSLLLNSNSKFIQLKKKIQNFNNSIDKGIDRKHLQYQYIKKLYEMLRQMTQIPNYQNQQQFLNNVYQWSNQGKRKDFQFDQFSQGSKSRPTTATTRARPFSAYTRPKSGVQKMNLVRLQQPINIKLQNRNKQNIDYEKIKPGQIQFYTGARTMHQGQQKPKKQLKEYQRKIFYQEQQDSDIQIIDLKEDTEIKPYKIINIQNQQPQLQQLQGQNQQQGEQNPMQDGQNGGGQDEGVAGGQQVNIDDLPIQGQILEEQAQQIVDKLKPNVKAFADYESNLSKNQKNYARGIKECLVQGNNKIRKVEEDKVFQQKMILWAKQKSRVKREQKRRAESARIVTKRIGIGFAKNEKQEENINTINFKDIQIPETKLQRPKTAFRGFNEANRKQIINNCFITGNLGSHTKRMEQIKRDDLQNIDGRFMRVTSLAEKPRKKTFQQILREAGQKVKEEEEEEIIQVKQKFAKNKVAFETNRIAKSMTCHGMISGYEEEEFAGVITGMNMIKNPFFKVGKKKKKKKKAK